MDPDTNVRERIALLEQETMTRDEWARYRELSRAYSEWRGAGGFPADAGLLQRLRKLRDH